MPELNPREMQQALAQPFAPEDLEWRLQNTIEDKKNNYFTWGISTDGSGAFALLGV